MLFRSKEILDKSQLIVCILTGGEPYNSEVEELLRSRISDSRREFSDVFKQNGKYFIFIKADSTSRAETLLQGISIELLMGL